MIFLPGYVSTNFANRYCRRMCEEDHHMTYIPGPKMEMRFKYPINNVIFKAASYFSYTLQKDIHVGLFLLRKRADSTVNPHVVQSRYRA